MHIHEFSISGADPEFRVQATSKRTLCVSLMDANLTRTCVVTHFPNFVALPDRLQHAGVTSQLTWVEATVATTKRENDDEGS
jgi:peroxiredoxin